MPITLHHAHPWDLPPKDAVALQRRLAGLVREERLPAPPETVCGVDVSVRGDRVRTALVVVRVADAVTVDEAVWEGGVAYPYVPGLLSFREMPAVLPALERLSVWPDAFMLDAQGRAHPRRFGLACHLGVLLDVPALGVAKTRLTGRHEEPAPEKGAAVPLRDGDETIGMVVRTRARTKPVFVSVGHRITLDEAAALALRMSPRYKIPEPTRRAHLLSKNGPAG